MAWKPDIGKVCPYRQQQVRKLNNKLPALSYAKIRHSDLIEGKISQEMSTHRVGGNRNAHISMNVDQKSIETVFSIATVSIDFWSAFVDCWFFRMPPTRCDQWGPKIWNEFSVSKMAAVHRRCCWIFVIFTYRQPWIIQILITWKSVIKHFWNAGQF